MLNVLPLAIIDAHFTAEIYIGTIATCKSLRGQTSRHRAVAVSLKLVEVSATI